MEMKNPVHPGILVAECLHDLGISVAEAAKGLGITRQQLHNVIAARSSITPEMAIRFEKALGGTADTWLRMQVNYDLSRARELEKRSGVQYPLRLPYKSTIYNKKWHPHLDIKDS